MIGEFTPTHMLPAHLGGNEAEFTVSDCGWDQFRVRCEHGQGFTHVKVRTGEATLLLPDPPPPGLYRVEYGPTNTCDGYEIVDHDPLGEWVILGWPGDGAKQVTTWAGIVKHFGLDAKFVELVPAPAEVAPRDEPWSFYDRGIRSRLIDLQFINHVVGDEKRRKLKIRMVGTRDYRTIEAHILMDSGTLRLYIEAMQGFLKTMERDGDC